MDNSTSTSKPPIVGSLIKAKTPNDNIYLINQSTEQVYKIIDNFVDPLITVYLLPTVPVDGKKKVILFPLTDYQKTFEPYLPSTETYFKGGVSK